MTGGLGLVPLATLGRLPAGSRVPSELQSVVNRLEERVRREAAPDDVNELLSAALILSGLRVPKEQWLQLFRGVQGMHESSTYQAILDEGREEGALRAARAMLLRIGRAKFRIAGPEIEAAVQSINDLDRLERLSERLLTASGWEELLATP